jgi:hypothetical protein
MFENEFMSPSERLTAFLDGELTQAEAGTLFYELAQNPELQDEMRQLVTIRNTFRNSMLVPPPYLKSKVFKRAGIPNNSMSGLSKTAAALAGLFYSRTAVTAVAVATFGVLSYFMISSNLGNTEPNKNISKKSVGSSIPVISSSEKGFASNQMLDNSKPEAHNTNSVIVNKNKSVNKISEDTGKFFPSESNKTPDNDNSSLVLALKEGNNTETSRQRINDITNSLMANNQGLFVNNSKSNNQLFNANSIDLHRFLEKVNIEFRTFAGVSSPSFVIGNNNSTLLNNSSLGINYTVNDHHTLGLAFGFENFLMSFDKYDGEILYSYKQSYNSIWGAATYQYSFNELGESNFRPFVNVLAGGTKVGPILKMSGGLSYYITDNFALLAGIETGWLFYPNKSDWMQSDWYSTNKSGLLFGLKVGF